MNCYLSTNSLVDAIGLDTKKKIRTTKLDQTEPRAFRYISTQTRFFLDLFIPYVPSPLSAIRTADKKNSARYNRIICQTVENTSFLERLSCILHSHVCEMYQGYKSNFGFHVFFFRPRNPANPGSKIRFWIRRKEHTLRFASPSCQKSIASSTGNANDRTSFSLESLCCNHLQLSKSLHS